jgi:trehalose 6-phosphate phosphatase
MPASHTAVKPAFSEPAPLDPPPDLSLSACLFLDFDGTLVELAPLPDQVRVSAAAISVVRMLYARLGGAVAVITGRHLHDVDRLLAPLCLPGAGVHGAELRFPDGSLRNQHGNADTAALVRSLRQRFGANPRLLIEDKGAAVALHFRQAPEMAQECIDAMREQAAVHGLATVYGKQVIEARPAGVNKGSALRELAACPPFAGRMPIFVGDDVTDEDGFEAVAALGGYGVKVGPGATHAEFRCPTVIDVHAWLACSLEA